MTLLLKVNCTQFIFIRNVQFFISVLAIIFPGHEKVIRALIEFGAKVNAEDKNKMTPLHHAAYWGELLLYALAMSIICYSRYNVNVDSCYTFV